MVYNGSASHGAEHQDERAQALHDELARSIQDQGNDLDLELFGAAFESDSQDDSESHSTVVEEATPNTEFSDVHSNVETAATDDSPSITSDVQPVQDTVELCSTTQETAANVASYGNHTNAQPDADSSSAPQVFQARNELPRGPATPNDNTLAEAESKRVEWVQRMYDSMRDRSDVHDSPDSRSYMRFAIDDETTAEFYNTQKLVDTMYDIFDFVIDGAKNGFTIPRLRALKHGLKAHKDRESDTKQRLEAICGALKTEKSTCYDTVEFGVPKIQEKVAVVKQNKERNRRKSKQTAQKRNITAASDATPDAASDAAPDVRLENDQDTSASAATETTGNITSKRALASARKRAPDISRRQTTSTVRKRTFDEYSLHSEEGGVPVGGPGEDIGGNAISNQYLRYQPSAYIPNTNLYPQYDRPAQYPYIHFPPQQEFHQGIHQGNHQQGIHYQGIHHQNIRNQGIYNQGIHNQGIYPQGIHHQSPGHGAIIYPPGPLYQPLPPRRAASASYSENIPIHPPERQLSIEQIMANPIDRLYANQNPGYPRQMSVPPAGPSPHVSLWDLEVEKTERKRPTPGPGPKK